MICNIIIKITIVTIPAIQNKYKSIKDFANYNTEFMFWLYDYVESCKSDSVNL